MSVDSSAQVKSRCRLRGSIYAGTLTEFEELTRGGPRAHTFSFRSHDDVLDVQRAVPDCVRCSLLLAGLHDVVHALSLDAGALHRGEVQVGRADLGARDLHRDVTLHPDLQQLGGRVLLPPGRPALPPEG